MDEGKGELIQRKGRHRKKQLYNTILQQMEFYFSDSNLTKDRFLSQLTRENPYVELSQFLKFNKIRRLTENIDDLRKAIKKSDILELSEDQEKIKRKTPVAIKENVDECTIYVERISSDANHEFLTNIFSDFGNVVYVSIPKYKHNHMNKGFAFIEFETEKEAQNVVDYFENIGCKMSSNINPEDLYSISSYVKESQMNIDEMKESDSNEKLDIITKGQKRKDFEGKTQSSKKSKIEEINHSEDVTQNEESECKKKKKKEHKKKNLIKELGLQVLSKQEWKKMRNGYLNLQRKKMKEIKMHLNQSKFSKHNLVEKIIKEPENHPSKEILQEKPTKLEYIPGTIVKVKLQEPLQSDKKIKMEIKAVTKDAKYVDVPFPSGSLEVFVRFSTNEAAQKFCTDEFSGTRSILEGDEEKEYWKKIDIDRNNKFQKSKKKQRGRDKLLKKAEKNFVKHTRFDENE